MSTRLQQLRSAAKAAGIGGMGAELDNKPIISKPTEPKILPVSDKRVPRLKHIAEYSQSFTLSAQQQDAADAIIRGDSCCVTGVAGAGKTAVLVTGILGAIRRVPPLLLRSGDYYRYTWLCDPDHKYLHAGNPGIIVVAFTNSAVRNLASRLPLTLDYEYEDETGQTVQLGQIHPRSMCISIHKLLQFRLMDEDIADIDGDSDTGKSWQPYRRAGNYLPPELKTIIVDEGTLPNVQLIQMLLDAIHPASEVQIVIAGDLFQIQSVGGMSALAAFSTFMDVKTLTHCYRHDGAIINLATDIRKQRTKYLMPASDIVRGGEGLGKTRQITYGVRNPAPEPAMRMVSNFLANGILRGSFVPGLDMAICFHDPVLMHGVPKYGITSLYRTTQEKVDAERGTLTHFVRLASRDKHGINAVLVAAGDVVTADFGGSRSIFMIMRCNRNTKYRGKIHPPMRYATRDPDKWLKWARIDEGTISQDFLSAALNAASDWDEFSMGLHEVEDADQLVDEIGEFDADGESGSGKIGRKATHYLYVVDLAQLQVEIASRAESSADAELLLEHVIKRLDYAARMLDYKAHVQGLTISDAEFTDSIRGLMSTFGLDDVMQEAMMRIDRGSEIKDIQSWLFTAHRAQGLSGRVVVVATHPDIPGFTEYVYTACTRAREQLITFSHPAFWGLPSDELIQKIKSGEIVHPDVSPAVVAKGSDRAIKAALSHNWRSDVYSAQIKGVTIPEKVDSIIAALATGKGGITRKDLEPFKERLFNDINYQAPIDWRLNYEDDA